MKTRAGFLISLICALGLLTACQPQSEVPLQAPTLAATQPPVEVTRELEAATPMTDTTIKVSIACPLAAEIKRYKLDSQLLTGELYVTVYLPPCYDEAKAGGYPVLYLLHGQTFDDGMWLDLGAGRIADELISDGIAQPFLMVMPFEEFYYRQAANNQFPDAITDEIIPFVDATFNTCTERACRALGGISRGLPGRCALACSTGAVRLVGAHSLPTFKGDLDELPDWLEQIPDGSAPRLYLDIGRFDPEVKTAYRFEQVLKRKAS